MLAASGISEPVIRIYAEDDLSLAAYLDERFSAAAEPTDQEVLQAGEANRRKLAEISAALNPECDTTGAMMLRRVR